MNRMKGYLLTAVALAVVAFFHYRKVTFSPMRGVSVIHTAGTENLKGEDRSFALDWYKFIGCGEFRFTFKEKRADYVFYPAGDEVMFVVARPSDQIIYEGPATGACEAIKQLEN